MEGTGILVSANLKKRNNFNFFIVRTYTRTFEKQKFLTEQKKSQIQ